MSNVLKFKRLSSDAFSLSKTSNDDAGFDLCSAYDYLIRSKSKELIKTDIAIDLPKGTYGRISSRSGLVLKNSIIVAGGVIDPGYRGNICVILFNLGENAFQIKRGDRIGQLICEKLAFPILEETNELNITKRNTNGFGSSGIQYKF